MPREMAAPTHRLRVCLDPSVELGPLSSRQFVIAAPTGPAARVADVAAALRSRLALADAPRLLLAVDGFTLPAGERLTDVFRDGEVLVVRAEGTGGCGGGERVREGEPTAKRMRRGASGAGDALLAIGDRLQPEGHSRQSQRVPASFPTPPRRDVAHSAGAGQNQSESDVARGTLSSAQAVKQAQDALKAAFPAARQKEKKTSSDGVASPDELALAKKAALAALAGGPRAPASIGTSKHAASTVTTPKTHSSGVVTVASPKSTSKHAVSSSACDKGIGPASLSHPILGDLEVPAGLDVETFVQRKLRRLGAAIRKQVEHYFSVANMARDEHLQSLVNAEGYVPISEIAEFERVRQLTDNAGFITESIKVSESLEVSPGGDFIRKRA